MTNEKFTQGGFRRAFNMSRNGKSVRGLSHCRIENEKGVVIAFTVPQKSRQEQIANTNLLAKAPEMYKKLEEIANLFFTISYRMLECKENKNANAYMRKSMEIQKLLAEARGEE